MFTRRIRNLLPLVLVASAVMACAVAATKLNADNTSNQTDPISGEWNVQFLVEGNVTPAMFNLKLEGNTISGTAYSDHTGAGKIRDGKWADNKLSFTLDFASHESIVITGAPKDGGLAGDFHTEGFVSSWVAKRKSNEQKAASSTTKPAGDASDPISGGWNATFAVGERKADITLVMALAGNKVTGTSESSMTGSGTLTDGSWIDNQLSFTMPGPHGPIHVSGTLKDGVLKGGFEMAEMKGTWEARRK